MGKKNKKRSDARRPGISGQEYKDTLHILQVELVKLQRHFIAGMLEGAVRE